MKQAFQPHLTQEGMRLERTATDMVPRGTRLRMTEDRILVKPHNWTPSKIIHVVDNVRKPLCGTVVAVGPGMYPWKYSPDRSKRWRSKHFRPTEVKVGDVIELGGLEINGYDFPQVVIENELHIIASERDVCGIHHA